MLLNGGAGEDSSKSLGLQGDPISKSERKSILNIHWKDWCWSWSSNTLATWCKELAHWKRPWCWERLKAGREGDDRGGDGWMASTNSMDLSLSELQAWRAAVYGVAKSRKQMSDWTTKCESPPLQATCQNLSPHWLSPWAQWVLRDSSSEPHPIATFSVALLLPHTHCSWLSIPSVIYHTGPLIEFHRISEPEGAYKAYYPTFSFNSWENKIYSWELLKEEAITSYVGWVTEKACTGAREARKQRDAQKGAEMRDRERGFPGGIVPPIPEIQSLSCLQHS